MTGGSERSLNELQENARDQLRAAVISEQRASLVAAIVPIVLPIMVVAVPLADMALAVIRRTIRGESPWAPDSHHLHHQLLRYGHSHRWAVAVLYVWTAVFSYGTVALVFTSTRDALMMLGAGAVVASAITFSPKFRVSLARVLRAAVSRGMGALRSAIPRVRDRGARPRDDASDGDEATSVAAKGKK